MNALILSVILVIAITPVVSAAETYSDISGHWAKDAIERWSALEILKGSDGKFRPDDSVTRAELSAILNRLLKYPASDRPIFLDLPETAWYYNDMTALAWQGILNDSYNYANGSTELTRNEVAQLTARAFGLDINEVYESISVPVERAKIKDAGLKDFVRYSDSSSVESLVLKYYGFLNGYPDGTFKSANLVTRAEVATILDNMITTYIDKPGTYEMFLGNGILVSVPGVTLKNQTPKALFVAPGVGTGNITLIGGNLSDCVRFVITPDESALILPDGSAGRTVYTPLEVCFDTRFDGGTGTEANPYIIASQAQLELLRGKLKKRISRSIEEYTEHAINYVELSTDITLTEKWIPINTAIAFDGRGHTIRGMNVDTMVSSGPSNYYAGLFGSLSGSVKNLTVEGNIVLNGEIANESGKICAGGIAGGINIFGMTENCVSKVNVKVNGSVSAAGGGAFGIVTRTYPGTEGYTFDNCVSAGNISITGSKSDNLTVIDVGGIVGNDLLVPVVNCRSTGTISVTNAYFSSVGGVAGVTNIIQNCSSNATVSVEGISPNAGGIVGLGAAENCVSSGNVSAASSDRTEYSAAAGGIAGRAVSKTITGCFASGNVSAKGGCQSTAGGVVGLLTNSTSASGDSSAPSVLNNSYATGSVTAADAEMQNNAGAWRAK